jgi:hypothetical protein
MAIIDQFIAPLAGVALKVIQEFHASPEEKAQAQQAINDAVQKAQQQAQDYEVQLNTIAGQNIRADATSGDKYTERARPTFMYVVISVIAFNYMFLPFAQIFGSKIGPIVLPADLLTLFGVCVTGYVFARSADKALALPGDSQINILGIKAGNKS